ncbi:MAG: BolA/IbaG family iron-sulfur metabolism protein [Planctomycetota bacterium]|nr:MAG: BolA/IbaG family iron-sulfur metabolism protein [Planctomycetota bacterium]
MSASIEEIQSCVREALGDVREVIVEDLTGGGDHFRIQVHSPVFVGKPLLEQHRLVQSALRSFLDSGKIHAIEVKTVPIES